MFSYLLFFQALVILGAFGLLFALHPAYLLISELPSGDIKTRWKVLFGLIITFIIGYCFVLFSLSGMPDSTATHILVFILFGGGIFVWVLCHLSVNTLSMAKRLVELEHENIHDSLMGIYNRRHLDNTLADEFNRARRYSLPLTYMMLDIDHFKAVNDKFGHDIGDDVLVALAKIIKQQARETDIIARYGGEEIGIICPLTDADGAKTTAERIMGTIDKELTISLDEMCVKNNHEFTGEAHNITVSIGVACINDDVEELYDLMKQADKALYEAKYKGRNRLVIASCCDK